MRLHKCDNCGRRWSESNLLTPRDLFERTDPEGAVPSGECPECGCLCYPTREYKVSPPIKESPAIQVSSLVINYEPYHGVSTLTAGPYDSMFEGFPITIRDNKNKIICSFVVNSLPKFPEKT